MSLFKRRGPDEESREPAGAETRVLGEREILERIEEEIFRANRYGRPLVVLCALPRRLPNEASSPGETALAAEAVAAELRFSDRVGTLSDGTVVAVLPETHAEATRVVSHRIATDLSLRGTNSGHRKWLVGVATFPGDGGDPPTIVTAAIQRALV